MTKFVLPVEVEPLPDGGYFAICDLIQGCHAEGETIPEALDNLEDVARILLELQREDGLPLPQGLEQLTPGAVMRAQLVVTVTE